MNEVAQIELISNESFHKAHDYLSFETTVLLGENEEGRLVLDDLESIRHLLIAGASGSGKTVCINSMIVSMLLGCSVEKIKFIMIDPKAVELSMYKRLPHLIYPIITDSKRAVEALEWAVNEMDTRYENVSVNAPKIVIIIDEIVDLLNSSRESVEKLLLQILEKGSEVGIHLIMSAQNPTSKTLSGIFFAGVTSRICLRVISEDASKTVIGTSGGEKLKGKGDMLFVPFEATQPIHIQGAYISNEEIKAVVNSFYTDK